MNLSEAERDELMAMQRSRTMAVGQVRRARLILLLDHGASREAIMNELRCDSRFITTTPSPESVVRSASGTASGDGARLTTSQVIAVHG
jgi:hypothetical protein